MRLIVVAGSTRRSRGAYSDADQPTLHTAGSRRCSPRVRSPCPRVRHGRSLLGLPRSRSVSALPPRRGLLNAHGWGSSPACSPSWPLRGQLRDWSCVAAGHSDPSGLRSGCCPTAASFPAAIALCRRRRTLSAVVAAPGTGAQRSTPRSPSAAPDSASCDRQHAAFRVCDTVLVTLPMRYGRPCMPLLPTTPCRPGGGLRWRRATSAWRPKSGLGLDPGCRHTACPSRPALARRRRAQGSLISLFPACARPRPRSAAAISPAATADPRHGFCTVTIGAPPRAGSRPGSAAANTLSDARSAVRSGPHHDRLEHRCPRLRAEHNPTPLCHWGERTRASSYMRSARFSPRDGCGDCNVTVPEVCSRGRRPSAGAGDVIEPAQGRRWRARGSPGGGTATFPERAPPLPGDDPTYVGPSSTPFPYPSDGLLLPTTYAVDVHTSHARRPRVHPRKRVLRVFRFLSRLLCFPASEAFVFVVRSRLYLSLCPLSLGSFYLRYLATSCLVGVFCRPFAPAFWVDIGCTKKVPFPPRRVVLCGVYDERAHEAQPRPPAGRLHRRRGRNRTGDWGRLLKLTDLYWYVRKGYSRQPGSC